MTAFHQTSEDPIAAEDDGRDKKKKELNIMFKSKCPHCGAKLHNYMYADACPHCQHELEENTKVLTSAPAKGPPVEKIWPIRFFLGAVRLVES